ncbi:ATP-dependent endonuclease, partial [Burkholderia pseudomallei]
TIADLLNATVEQRIQARTVASDALIRVSYQTSVNASWRGTTAAMVGRTLEEAFALENLAWCQDAARAEIRLRVRGCNKLSLEQIAQSLHRKIKSANFRKTDFALALLSQDPSAWTVPAYISEGLLWLEHEVVPHPPEIAAPPINAGAVA